MPGSDLVAACDAIVPSMVERDPEWAGWCAVLVNVNDLAAMGAAPVGLLDALGARDAVARRPGARRACGARAGAYGVPVLGGHTQLGVPAALSVTALGRTAHPVPGGGGRPGHAVRLTADLGGGWRPGYAGRQWDSTSHRRAGRAAGDARRGGRRAARPPPRTCRWPGSSARSACSPRRAAARAVLDVAAVPRPAGASVGDWLTCFPGFAMLTADEPGAPPLPAGPGGRRGVRRADHAAAASRLRWPDGRDHRGGHRPGDRIGEPA